jgi:hypothetical protein
MGIKKQKTVFGYNAKAILRRVNTVATMGGSSKRVVTLPTFAGTVAHFNVEDCAGGLLLKSGLKHVEVAF